MNDLPNPTPPENAPEIPAPEIPAPVHTPKPPPAAALVTDGNVKSETELALEQRVRDLEFEVSEKERLVQELKDIPAPVPVKPPKVKRSSWRPIIDIEDDETDETPQATS